MLLNCMKGDFCVGILGKVIGAGASLIGAGAQAIGKKIEDAFLKQQQKNLEYLSKYPYKYKYIVREVKRKMDDMVFTQDLGLSENFFAVYNAQNEPIIVTKPLSSNSQQKCVVIDLAGKELARIENKKALFSSSKQNCVISTQDKKYEIGTSVSLDKRKFSMPNCDLSVECDDTGKEIKIVSKRKKIMQINKVASDLGVKWGEYIIGCDAPEHSEQLILLSISIGMMLVESDNLLELK